MALPETPLTREEIYLNGIATGDPSNLPEPITRIEMYLYEIAMNGGGGGGSGDVSGVKGAVETTFRKGNVNLTIQHIANLEGGLTYDTSSKTITGTQYSTMPTPANIFVGRTIQYVGVDTADYKSGRFYKCIIDGLEYKWEEVPLYEEAEGLTNEQINALLNLL